MGTKTPDCQTQSSLHYCVKIQVLCFCLEGKQHPGSEPCSRDQPGHSAAQNVTEFHPGKGLVTMAVTQAALLRERNAWSAIHHGSPELSWAEVTLQGMVQGGVRGESSELTCCAPYQGLWFCPASGITALHFSHGSWGVYCFLHFRKLCFVVYFPPVIFWNMAVLQFYWCEILVFTGNINQNHSKVLLFSWAGKTNSHSLCQSGSCNDRKLSMFSFPDIPLQWLPWYNSSWLPSCKHFHQLSVQDQPPHAWLYFPECTSQRKLLLDSRAPFQCFQNWLINSWQVIMHPCMTRSHQMVLLINTFIDRKHSNTSGWYQLVYFCPYFNSSFVQVILILPYFWLISKEDTNEGNATTTEHSGKVVLGTNEFPWWDIY